MSKIFEKLLRDEGRNRAARQRVYLVVPGGVERWATERERKRKHVAERNARHALLAAAIESRIGGAV